jgi:hypothetical protein
MEHVEARRDELPTARRIVSVCRSGRRSGKVAAQLREEGYEADNVEGGMPRAQAEVYAEAVAGATGVPVNQVVFVFPRAGSEVALSLLSGVSTVRDNG